MLSRKSPKRPSNHRPSAVASVGPGSGASVASASTSDCRKKPNAPNVEMRPHSHGMLLATTLATYSGGRAGERSRQAQRSDDMLKKARQSNCGSSAGRQTRAVASEGNGVTICTGGTKPCRFSSTSSAGPGSRRSTADRCAAADARPTARPLSPKVVAMGTRTLSGTGSGDPSLRTRRSTPSAAEKWAATEASAPVIGSRTVPPPGTTTKDPIVAVPPGDVEAGVDAGRYDEVVDGEGATTVGGAGVEMRGARVGERVGDRVGERVGEEVGASDGARVGRWVGAAVGARVGRAVGRNVGTAVGCTVGWGVGFGVGETTGGAVGILVGFTVGKAVGVRVGPGVGGTDVGTGDGWAVGIAVGTRVGNGVGPGVVGCGVVVDAKHDTSIRPVMESHEHDCTKPGPQAAMQVAPTLAQGSLHVATTVLSTQSHDCTRDGSPLQMAVH
mmetsp:Transcript_2697/g.8669  ORF Transcript_2697/g.8669 Transcript_2697/m.8669 type:complete len:443 (-) Transcript_2697:393-1721(-)